MPPCCNALKRHSNFRALHRNQRRNRAILSTAATSSDVSFNGIFYIIGIWLISLPYNVFLITKSTFMRTTVVWYKKRNIRMFNNPSTPMPLLRPAVQPLFCFFRRPCRLHCCLDELQLQNVCCGQGLIQQQVHTQAFRRGFSV